MSSSPVAVRSIDIEKVRLSSGKQITVFLTFECRPGVDAVGQTLGFSTQNVEAGLGVLIL